ncbi:hypothetical protein PTI98_005475 [Pleurotus ostreatus]|nr:hypothetical protein PTI98_005475 [Pleurotus ostreatus]
MKPNPELFFGPMLLGVFFNTILYGILVVQIFNYFQVYKRSDKPLIRYLVIYLLVLETFGTACVIHMMYEVFVMPMGAPKPPGPPKPPTMLPADAITTVLISTPVQLFLAWRISVLTSSKIVAIFISLLAITSLGGGIAMSALVILNPDFSRFETFYPATGTWLGSSALADVIISTALVMTLRRKRTGMQVTDNIINKIMTFTIQTGFVTAVFAIADVVLALTLRDSGFNFIPDFMLSKLYSNTLIASLNARVDFGQVLNNPNNVLFKGPRKESQSSVQIGTRSGFTTILADSRHFSDNSRQYSDFDHPDPPKLQDIELGRSEQL